MSSTGHTMNSEASKTKKLTPNEKAVSFFMYGYVKNGKAKQRNFVSTNTYMLSKRF